MIVEGSNLHFNNIIWLVLVIGISVFLAGCLVASVVWMWLACRRVLRECRNMQRELKGLLEQAGDWRRQAATLYPSLADLIDDKLALMTVPNGHRDEETGVGTAHHDGGQGG